jgi:hypothetical protein
MGENRNEYRIFILKREGKIPLGRRRLRWEDNIQIHFREIRGRVWIGFIWLRIGTSGGLL